MGPGDRWGQAKGGLACSPLGRGGTACAPSSPGVRAFPASAWSVGCHLDPGHSWLAQVSAVRRAIIELLEGRSWALLPVPLQLGSAQEVT